MNEEIMQRFSFHICDDEGMRAMRNIRVRVRDLAVAIDVLCPDSEEKATALTQLSFVMMSANSAIEQKYPIDPKEFDYVPKTQD